MNKHVTITEDAIIEGRVLAAALRPICYVIEKRSTMPILESVRIVVTDTRMIVTGTDLDIEVSATLDLIGNHGEWSLCVSSKMLMEIAKLAGPMPIRIERLEQHDKAPEMRITFDDASASYQIPAMGTDGFPTITGDRGDKIESFGNGFLGTALRRCERVISTEETRYYLNGVCWTIVEGGRWFAATDGHRLLKYSYSKDGGASQSRIIPRKAVALITRYFAKDDATVYDLSGGMSKIEIVTGQFVVRAKLVEGTFPDIDRVIPKPEQPLNLPTNRARLETALSRLSPMRDGRAVKLCGVDGDFALQRSDNNGGEASAIVGTTWPSDMGELGLNGRYLHDLLQTCDGDITFTTRDAGSPILIIDGDGTMTRVIMPMRV